MTFALNTIATATTNSNQPLTMSSREIAELTGKEHRNVIRDIRETLEALEEDALKFESIYLDAYGREKPCFNLPKDLTITLISGYNVKMRHAITKRWMELEAAKAPAIPRTYAEALMAAAQAEMAKEALALENAKKDEVIAEMAPKADFFDAAVDAGAVYTPTTIAAMLGLPEYRSAQKVNELMAELGWQYKKGGKWQATAFAVENGYLTAKAFVDEDTGFSGTNARVTPKGFSRLRHRVGLGLTDEQIEPRPSC